MFNHFFFLSTPSTSSTKIGYQDQEPSSHNNECVYWQVYMCFVRAQRISIPRIGTFRLLKTILVRLVKYRQVRCSFILRISASTIRKRYSKSRVMIGEGGECFFSGTCDCFSQIKLFKLRLPRLSIYCFNHGRLQSIYFLTQFKIIHEK